MTRWRDRIPPVRNRVEDNCAHPHHHNSDRRLLNGQTHPRRAERPKFRECLKNLHEQKRRTSMWTWIRKVVTATAAILALTLLLAAPASAQQMPPGCNANLLRYCQKVWIARPSPSPLVSR